MNKPLPQKQVITEHKQSLSGDDQTFPCELGALEEDQLVLLYRLPGLIDLHGIELRAGTLSYGYFWKHRPYNIYHFCDSKGASLAWYGNISDSTHWNSDSLFWRDLIVDVLIQSDGSIRILDREELPEDLAPNLRCYIDEATDKLLAEKIQIIQETTIRTKALYAAGVV